MNQLGTESISISGRTLLENEIELIREVMSSCSGLSRFELANTVCELLDWRRASGKLKTRECRDLLERLAEREVIRLPNKGAGRPVGTVTSVGQSRRGEAGEVLEGTLKEIAPVCLERVVDKASRQLWRELVERYHYLGHAVAYGAHLRYLIKAKGAGQAIVGCLQYSSAAWRMAERDRWIGWSEPVRRQQLQRVVNQSRFLILPWVRVRHLASHVLGLSAARVAEDWEERFGVRPLLLESLVDVGWAGTCYRAANWVEVGKTSGRGRMDRRHQRHGQAPKRVFVYALVRDARRQLREAAAGQSNPEPQMV